MVDGLPPPQQEKSSPKIPRFCSNWGGLVADFHKSPRLVETTTPTETNCPKDLLAALGAPVAVGRPRSIFSYTRLLEGAPRAGEMPGKYFSGPEASSSSAPAEDRNQDRPEHGEKGQEGETIALLYY